MNPIKPKPAPLCKALRYQPHPVRLPGPLSRLPGHQGSLETAPWHRDEDTYVYIYTCVYVYMYVCMHVCAHTYILVCTLAITPADSTPKRRFQPERVVIVMLESADSDNYSCR